MDHLTQLVYNEVVNFFVFVGSGKTQFIHKQLRSDVHDDHISVSINETFTKKKCIEELKKCSHKDFNAAIYLKISLFLSKVYNINYVFCYNIFSSLCYYARI